MTCINRGSLPMRKGSSSLESRESFCNRHWHTGISLFLRGFFLSSFSRIFIVFAINFSVILLYSPLYFSAWIHSLRIIHCNSVWVGPTKTLYDFYNFSIKGNMINNDSNVYTKDFLHFPLLDRGPSVRVLDMSVRILPYFSIGDDGPRKSNWVWEDDGLK